jgi:hypothetical protein
MPVAEPLLHLSIVLLWNTEVESERIAPAGHTRGRPWGRPLLLTPVRR